MKPFYVERMVSGQPQWLLVQDWQYSAWNGAFCLINDKAHWA